MNLSHIVESIQSRIQGQGDLEVLECIIRLGNGNTVLIQKVSGEIYVNFKGEESDEA